MCVHWIDTNTTQSVFLSDSVCYFMYVSSYKFFKVILKIENMWQKWMIIYIGFQQPM